MQQLFLTSSSDYVMDDIVKKLPKNPKEMNIAFINTAAEIVKEDHWWVRDEKNKLIEVGFNVDEFTIKGLDKEEIEKKFKNKQIIYFCGGNAYYLLDQVIKTGCDEILKEKIESGIIYMGSSAGSMIVGKRIDLVPDIDESSKAPDLKSSGLEIIDLSIQPHWGSSEFRSGYLKGFESMYTEGVKVILLTNRQYIWIRDDTFQLVEVL
ncbi:MAG: Type 1 glutamine amidotransferase-like domain-containing protein [Patescibacteria group bacterium]